MTFRPVHHVTTPVCSKLGYVTRAEAVDAARALKVHRGHQNLQVYRCRWCSFFHLGRSSKKP